MKEKISKTVILSVIFGLLSAFVGTFFIFSFLAPTGFFSKTLDIESQNQEFLKTSLGIKAYGRLEVFEFLDKSLPAVTTIYKKKPQSNLLINKIYLDKDILGYGFVLTSDGWIVTNSDVLDGFSFSGIEIFIGGKKYAVKDIVKDSWTNIVFLKVEAKDLPVVLLGNSDTLVLGDILFTGTGKNNFWFSYVNGLGVYNDFLQKADTVISSENFGKVIKLQNNIPNKLNGSMVANRNGEVVGIVVVNKSDNYIVPINYFKDLVNDVLKNKKIVRPYLGVRYVDLDNVIAYNLPNNKGAYVYGGGVFRSVAFGSPAAQAGIKNGDIILSVEGELLGDHKNLAELISEFDPGETIKIKILRGEEEFDLDVVLGSS